MRTNTNGVVFVHLSKSEDLLIFQKEILDLFYQCFQFHLDEKLWEWAYLNNPLGSPIVNLAFIDNTLVGHYAFIPIPITHSSVLLSMTTMVKQSARKYNVFFDLAQKSYNFAKKNHFDFIVGFPNKKSAPVHEKLLDWKLFPSFVAQCDFENFLKNTPITPSHDLHMLDLNNTAFVNWRISKPNISYAQNGKNIYKFFDDQIDLLTLRGNYHSLDFDKQRHINFIVQSEKLERYKIFDYPFAIKNLRSTSIPDFYLELLMSDVF